MGTDTQERPTETPTYPERRGHQYHADAHLLSGRLERPIMQEIPQQAPLSLRDWRGGHLYQRVQGYDLEGLVSFKSGYTRVSGYRSEKKAHTFVTLATSVIEGLNIFDVLTADRVVAQVSTAHPEYNSADPGHVPEVTFLGTQFTNLKVGGYEVTLNLNLQICGERPKNDLPYLFDGAFLGEVRKQANEISKFSKAPDELKTQAEELKETYRQEVDKIDLLQEQVGKPDDTPRSLACSLVNDIILPRKIPGIEAVRNVLFVRDFGIVTLGKIIVGRLNDQEKGAAQAEMSNYFTLEMFNIRLGCVGEGKITAASGSGNGKGKP